MSQWTPPTIAEFQAQFYRDFPFAPPEYATDTGAETLKKFVINQDVQNAINLASIDFNDALFGTNATQIFMYLAAHYLIESLNAASMGLNSQARFSLESSSVGGVSIANNVWEWAKSNPQFAKFLNTRHGQIYLELVYPYTIGGGIVTLHSRTTYA
jgi:hypothetical protein